MADMEDTQNSAPGQPTVRESNKLGTVSRRQDTQSVTKRYHSLVPIYDLDFLAHTQVYLLFAKSVAACKQNLCKLCALARPASLLSLLPPRTSLNGTQQ